MAEAVTVRTSGRGGRAPPAGAGGDLRALLGITGLVRCPLCAGVRVSADLCQWQLSRRTVVSHESLVTCSYRIPLRSPDNPTIFIKNKRQSEPYIYTYEDIHMNIFTAPSLGLKKTDNKLLPLHYPRSL